MQVETTELIMISHMKVDLKKVNTSLNTLQSDVSTLETNVNALQTDVTALQNTSGSSSYVVTGIIKDGNINTPNQPFSPNVDFLKKENTFIFTDTNSGTNAMVLPDYSGNSIPVDTVVTVIRGPNCDDNVAIYLQSGNYMIVDNTYSNSSYSTFPINSPNFATTVTINHKIGFCVFKLSPLGWVFMAGNGLAAVETHDTITS